MFRGDITGYLQTFNENDGLPNEEVSSVVHCKDLWATSQKIIAGRKIKDPHWNIGLGAVHKIRDQVLNTPLGTHSNDISSKSGIAQQAKIRHYPNLRSDFEE